jgi:hypothetical protein
MRSVLIITVVTIFVVGFLADTVRRFWIHRQSAKGGSGKNDGDDDSKVLTGRERWGGRGQREVTERSLVLTHAMHLPSQVRKSAHVELSEL